MERLNAARKKAIGQDLTEKISKKNFIRYFLQFSPLDLLSTGRHQKFEMLFPGNTRRAIRKNAALPEPLLLKRNSFLITCL
jgi:hypothetical protein